jgi:RHS repeat-associated protein
MNLSSKTTFSNGSITNLPSGDTLAYDCEGNLSCVSNAVSGAVSLYWYDQHGRRIAKQENSLLTLYIWDGMDIIATAHADGTLREYYTRGIGIAGDVGSLVAETRFENNAAVSTTYLHSNWRGDVVMATDASGAVVGEYSYTTFGEQLSATGTYTPRFTFSSKERDASGLVYHGFRYYCPVLCRWISEDPIREFGGINLYQFCWNDPVNNIDTDGRKVEVHSRYVQGTIGFGAHTYITVTDSSGKVHTFGSYNRGGWNVAIENDPSDLKQNRTSSREIPPPQGMTQQEWDEAVLDAARIRVQELVPQKQEYKWYGGDGLRSGNCHRTTRRIIYDAGGQFPTDYNPPGANPGLESVFP